MAIFYTYPSNNAVTGKEEVLVSVPNKDNELRIVDLQSIANLKSNNSGVNRLFFSDSIGLSPSFTEAGLDPTAGTGVVEVTGTVNIAGGGTGKDITDLAAANVGDILTINTNKDGYDFSPPPTGETYTFSTEQNATTPANVDLFIEDSQSNKDTITLIPAGSVSLTADNVNNTITIDSTGGSTSLTPGDGININTNVISTSIGDGLGFNNAGVMVVDLNPDDLADTTGVQNGAYLQYSSSGGGITQWVNQASSNPTIFSASDIAISYFDTTSSSVKGVSGVVLDNKSQVVIGTVGAGNIKVLTFYLDFYIETNNQLTTGDEYLILTRKSTPEDGFTFMTDVSGGFHGSVTCCEAAINNTSSPLLTGQWQTLVQGCFIPTNESVGVPRTEPPIPSQLQNLLIMQANKEVGANGTQTTYVPTTEWIKPGNLGANFRYILAGTITVF